MVHSSEGILSALHTALSVVSELAALTTAATEEHAESLTKVHLLVILNVTISLCLVLVLAGDQECVCNFGFSGAACSEIFGYGPYVPADSDVNPTVMTPTPTSDKQSGGVEWTGIVITNYVATFVATLVIIFLLVWLFKCGGMQHGKMKGPPSRAQQREQRRAAQLVAQTPQTSTIMEPSETRFATHPPAFRVRPEGSTPLYAVQATVGSYSFTPVADNGSVTVHESAA